MTGKNYIPDDYDRIKIVPDVCSLLTEGFDSKANVIVYPRRVSGNFDILAQALAEHFKLGRDELFIKYKDKQRLLDAVDVLEDEDLRDSLKLLLSDMEFFHAAGARTHVRILKSYSEHSGTHDFHVDGLNQNFDRLMTCYNDPVTQYVRNEDVISVDGHKAVVRAGAPVYGFKPGDIWKQRVRNKKAEGLLGALKEKIEDKAKRAFVHRAQRSLHPRLMLVGDMSVKN